MDVVAPDDPKPQPPAEPGPDDCCRSGCTWCVLDLYYEELERYRSALAAWEKRHVSARTEGKARRR
ncbi:Oxidoreductase-like protein, N-terminal [Duganella sp. CF458]|uniref:oxidoreductase-like domain-containing protein n=1 Tax=Duganella sp. CF458 TaxID=1884368 RepID=UPI0008F34666|nr:oxidoreductase-like domain-containing protein [Duganella sp. CF458]SFF52300.1 Oxidoreductase-like protein, N-terminal [Duganella sp. CF458]